MVIDLIVTDTGDGYTGEVPSIKGCDCWAHTEDEVITKSVELVHFYLGIPTENKIKIDKARKKKNTSIYKLVIEKEG